MAPNRHLERGFTLVELVLTLLIFALVGSMMFHFLSSSGVLRSSEPIDRLEKAYALKQIVENMIERHSQDPSDLATLTGLVGPAGSSQDNDFGKYTVVRNDFIDFDADGNVDTTPAENNRLRVTVKDDTEAALTVLFEAN